MIRRLAAVGALVVVASCSDGLPLRAGTEIGDFYIAGDIGEGERCYEMVFEPDPSISFAACTDESFLTIEADALVAEQDGTLYMAIGGPVSGEVASVRVSANDFSRVVPPTDGYFILAFGHAPFVVEALAADGEVIQRVSRPAPPTSQPTAPAELPGPS